MCERVLLQIRLVNMVQLNRLGRLFIYKRFSSKRFSACVNAKTLVSLPLNIYVNISERKSGTRQPEKRESARAQIYDETTVSSAKCRVTCTLKRLLVCFVTARVHNSILPEL